MKWVFFAPRLVSGGAQQAAVLLSSALIALGHNVTLALTSLDGELIARVNERCRLFDLNATKPITGRNTFANLVNHVCPDAIICFGIYTGIAAALTRHRWQCRPAFVIRNENNLREDWHEGTLLNRIIGPTLSRWTARHSHIVTVSHSMAKPTADYLHIPDERVTTILNPVIDDTCQTQHSTPAALHPWLQNRLIPTFVAIGRLEHQKGFDILINAFTHMHNKTNARLVIFGQGSLCDSLQTQIDGAGLCEHITLAGYTDNPLAQMRAARAFVLSSRFEGFGLVLVEALRAGTQVIATDCPYGPSEILEQGRYGTLVPVDDPIALATAMLNCLEGKNLIPSPPDTWFKPFTASEAARQHIKLVESIISHRNKALR